MTFKLKHGVAVVLVALLAACGSAPTASSPGGSDYLLTVRLEPADTQEAVTQRYGGEVIAWLDGQAILRMTGEAVAQLQVRGISMQNTTLEANSALNVPMATAQGWNGWSGGWNAWSGGWNAWSSGWNAWSGGWNAWSGGTTPPQPPAENNAVWTMMQLRQAHALARNFGAGVKVAVVDTGLDTAHPMFAGRLAPSAEWRDFVDGDNNPQEVNSGTPNAFGHGTGVAGLILQVAPRATILPIRVLGPNGVGTLDRVIAGVNHALNSGARVINVSLGATDPSDALLTALSAAKARGVYVVASAGNNGQENALTYPARYAWWEQVHPFLFSVGSFNRRSELSLFSAYGNNFVLGGVGEGVVSAFPGSRTAQFTGTSFAAPLVSGALALAFGETTNVTARANLWQLAVDSAFTNDMWNRTSQARGGAWLSLGLGMVDSANLLRSLPGFAEPAAVASATNLLPNGGLETTASWGFESASRATSGQRSGSGALSVGMGGAWSHRIPVSPNTSYTVTAWFRFANLADAASLSLDQSDAASMLLERTTTSVKSDTTAYTSRSLTITTGPTTTHLNVVLWRGHGTSTVLVDDMRLVRNP
ncbi:MAG: S8 family serine peptidase [Meiothermus sp.]|nr:S8 family serine peptidase [Meiothermus sp.]